MICEHASSVMVQAVLTTRLSSRWRQQESGHRLSSTLPWRAEEPCGGRACGWLGKWPPACSCGYSILPSIPHLPPEGLGRAASSNNTVRRATPPRGARVGPVRRLGGQVFRVWNQTVRDIYFRLWTLFSVSRDWSSLPVPRGALKQGRSKKCLFPQNVLWWSFFTTLHPSDDAALTWMSHFIFKELLPLPPL